ncbi:LysR family transcriptional regulator [Bacillus sp. NP157]|nr:LysR family transcriptional regulator [Bacillus sp. NP157]
MILDLATLRTLVTAVDLGGFGRAAEKLHLSPSAVSLQLRALEDRLGTAIFQRVGRKQELTDAGERLLGYARHMLELNAGAVDAVRGVQVEGRVHVGVPHDFAEAWLPGTLAAFAAAHPATSLELTVDQSAALLQGVRDGGVDLALAFDSDGGMAGSLLGAFPVYWFAADGVPGVADGPLPLLTLEAPCVFRRRMIAALDAAHIPWRIAVTARSVSALWTAARAGLGWVARPAIYAPAGLRRIDAGDGLPALGDASVFLVRGERANPAADVLAGLLGNGVAATAG